MSLLPAVSQSETYTPRQLFEKDERVMVTLQNLKDGTVIEKSTELKNVSTLMGWVKRWKHDHPSTYELINVHSFNLEDNKNGT